MSSELFGDTNLVGTWSDIPDGKKSIDLPEGSPSSETNETDSSVDLSTSTEIDKRDVKQSLLLLHSSRRRRHGSAVVLNSQKMQKILQGRNDEEANSPSEQEITVVAEAVSETRRPHFYLSKAAIKIQQCWRNHYYTQIRQNLEFKYSQGGKWTKYQSDRVISLILGWRIRFLMRSKRVQKTMKALTDVYKVLSEVITSSTNSSPVSSSALGAANQSSIIAASATSSIDKIKMLDMIRQLSRNQSTQSSISSKITYADRLLVDHLVKEALLMRSTIYKVLFEDCCWQSFQSSSSSSEYYSEVYQGVGLGSGYWDFSSAVQTVLNTSALTAERTTPSTKAITAASFSSPKRKGSMQSPSISRSASRQNGEYSSLETHWLGDSHDDTDFKCGGDTGSIYVPEEVGGFDRSQPIKRRVNAPFSEFPSDVGSSSSRGEDRPCTALSETGDSVIQSQLALLRVQALRKKSVGTGLGLSAAEEDDSEGDKGGKTRGPVVPRKTAGSSGKSAPTTSSGKASLTEPIRPDNCRACIQLDILHADRLMPAKKGSVARDAYGNMVPDRKPCLQVTLLMPTPTISPAKSKRPKPPGGNNGNGATYDSDDEEDDDSRTRPEELKKTHYIHREFTEITLNPRWKASEKKEGGGVFYLPLPCPKKIILSEAALAGDAGLVSESISDFSYTNEFTNAPSIRSAEEKDGMYSRACRGLLEHWGQGLVKIQIVDGERFNEDIFMGEVTLRLSTFLVPQAVSKKSALSSGGSTGQPIHEISGTYQLSKAKASDRVSGSLTLHAYLHMPDASYIEGIRTASIPQPLPHPVPQRRHTAAARVAWTDPSAAAAVSAASKRGVGPTEVPLKSDEPVEGSSPVNDWDDDDGDVLELSYAPHSPKVAESPDRRLFKTRPAVCSFGVHGHHGPDAKSKVRMRPAGADGSGSIVSGHMSLAQSELVGGSKKLGLDFDDGSDNDSDGNAAGEEGDEWDPSGLSNLKHGISPSRSAVKGLGSKSTASSTALNMNRQSMLDGVSKCLDGLSLAQDGADSLLERMQKQLEVRQSAKIAKDGEKSPPRRTKSESCILHGKAKVDDSFYVDTPSHSILNPTPRKAKPAGITKEKEKEKESKGKERTKDKDKEKENLKEGDEKFQVYKAVKVAAKSNFLSLSPAPVSLSPPPPVNTAPSPFRDVTDLADSMEGTDTGGDRGEEDEESESVDSSEMIVIASTGFTITKNSSGVEHMTSDPVPTGPVSLGVRLFGSRPDSPPSYGRFPASVPPSLSPLLEGEDGSREGDDGPSMSEGWRKRNIEREKRSANTSPVRSTLH